MMGNNLPKVYFASKAKHGQKWLDHYTAHGNNYDMTSTWAYEHKAGETADWDALWNNCLRDIASSDYLLAIFQEGEFHSGVYMEIGAALAGGKTVLVVNFPAAARLGAYSPIRHFQKVEDAFYFIQRDWDARPFVSEWPAQEMARFTLNVDVAVEDLPPQDVIQAVIEFTQGSVADELRELKLKARMRELQTYREKSGMAYADTIKKYVG